MIQTKPMVPEKQALQKIIISGEEVGKIWETTGCSLKYQCQLSFGQLSSRTQTLNGLGDTISDCIFAAINGGRKDAAVLTEACDWLENNLE